jgi:cadmium resistance protein CadD (predicted permease)
MNDLLSIILIAAAAFAACNIGEMFILMNFYLDRRFSTAEVVTGQYISAALLVALCLVIAFGLAAVSPAWLHWLGVLPIFIGIRNLMRAKTLLREELQEEERTVRRMGVNLLSVTAVTFADGSDNVGVFAPLFAHQSAAQNTVSVLVFLVLIGMWCYVAHYLLHHKKLGRHIRRWGVYIAPIALILIGLYILFQ